MSGAIQDLLVGSTGFVGGNLMASHDFHCAVHSADVALSFDTQPDLCIYAGVPSAMFLANSDPEADLALMESARSNLRRIKPRRVVLISTIAVYDDSRGKDERSQIDDSELPAYGRNRLQLERWVREDFENALIMRLPALYGLGLRKNFIKDMILISPPLLTEERYLLLGSRSELVRDSYLPRGDGYYAMSPTTDRRRLRDWFAGNDFNALSFTDSRSRFQFYGLDRLWGDITCALECEADLVNLATPPVQAGELYRRIRGRSWVNELSGQPFDYDMRTMHSLTEDGRSGYICTLGTELDAVRRFVEEETCRL